MVDGLPKPSLELLRPCVPVCVVLVQDEQTSEQLNLRYG
jgi:hypothetical protein